MNKENGMTAEQICQVFVDAIRARWKNRPIPKELAFAKQLADVYLNDKKLDKKSGRGNLH